jgi:hypothetical protein
VITVVRRQASSEPHYLRDMEPNERALSYCKQGQYTLLAAGSLSRWMEASKKEELEGKKLEG